MESKTGPTGVFERLEAQFEIAAGSMIAGLTKVATVSGGAGPDRIGLSCMASELGLKGDDGYIGAHAIGHGNFQKFAGISGPGLSRPYPPQVLGTTGQVHPPAPGSRARRDGTMLDNTLIVYLSDSAEGHHPVCQEWPFVLIGDLEDGSQESLPALLHGMETKATAPSPTFTSRSSTPSAKGKHFRRTRLRLGRSGPTGPLAEIMS